MSEPEQKCPKCGSADVYSEVTMPRAPFGVPMMGGVFFMCSACKYRSHEDIYLPRTREVSRYRAALKEIVDEWESVLPEPAKPLLRKRVNEILLKHGIGYEVP